MTFSANGYKTYFDPKNEPGPSKSENDFPAEERSNVWKNFIDCVRSRKREDLDNEILEGHMSAALGHLGVISYCTGRKLIFNLNEYQCHQNENQNNIFNNYLYLFF